MMIAFLVFLALMIASIVGGVRICMYLYQSSRRGCLPEHQLVMLSQEAFIEGRSGKPRRSRLDMGMGECVRRVSSISLGIVTVMVLLIVMFLNAAH